MARPTGERAKLRADHPDSWIAVNPGDELIGKLVDVTEAWSDQRNNGSFYPLLTIEADEATGYDEPGELKVHCFGAVLYNEVMRHRPEVGERVKITYKGTGEAKRKGYNPPEIYSLRVEGRTDNAQRTYDRIDGAQDESVRARQEELPQSDIPANVGAGADDDIPF